MAYIIVASIVMAYEIMACVVMAYILMAYIVMVDIVMADHEGYAMLQIFNLAPLMAIVRIYIVMAHVLI